MIGTIVNTGAIIAGSIAGALLHRGVKERYQQGLYNAIGLASLAIGLNATLSHLPQSRQPVLFILSMALGAVIGTALDIDGRFRRLVERRSKTKNTESSSDPNPRLADGLSTAILLFCIGPLSMLGPVISALNGDNTFLYTNATLDLLTSFLFASTYGIGILLAAPVLFVWQGLFYLAARLSAHAIGEDLMAELLITGGLLITASGLNLLRIKDCKALNLLPALLVPVCWYILLSLF